MQPHPSVRDNSPARVCYGEHARIEFRRAQLPADTVFGSAPWVEAAWRHLPSLGEPAVLTAEFEGRRWMLPLVIGRRSASLRLAGAPLGDAHDLIGPRGEEADEMADAVLDWLTRYPGPVDLQALDSGGALAAGLARHREDGWTLEREPAPVVPVAAARIGRGHCRRWAQLARHGVPRVRVLDGARVDTTAVAEFARRRLRRWELRGRSGDLPPAERSATFPCFLNEAAAGLARDDRARLWALDLDGLVIAEDLHLGPPRGPLLYMRTYDPRFSALSPGRVLLERTVLMLRDAGVAVLETGRGAERYKLELGAGEQYVVNARAGAIDGSAS